MLLPIILLSLVLTAGECSDVTRDFFGDIFHMRDCHNGSRCDGGGHRPALQLPGRPCFCQCSPTHLTYREDKQQCVKDIKECYMSVFYRPFTVEAIPLVYLPTSGQLVHPDAHLSLSMRRHLAGGLAKCRVTVSQYLTKDGWRTITKTDGSSGSVFGLFTDGNKTYLQFLGTSADRRLLQQHLTLIRLLCIIPDYPAFETCVAIRVGWVPGIENVEETTVPSNKANMMVVGLSLGVLALVYIFAVLVYLKIRRQMIAKQKAGADQEAKIQGRDDASDKTSSLHRLEASSRLEMYHSTSLGRQKQRKKNFDAWNQLSPLVETYNRTWTDRMGGGSEFRAQDLKLRPEFFEPEFMASPPDEVLEYLERLQNSVTFARHRLRTCYRYQPTLNGIPEDDYFYQELDSPSKEERTTPDGGSASSVGSTHEQKSEIQKRELPKIPPRKPKRKTVKNKVTSSDEEQKDIQNAINTLNDTLNALEYEMYKQEITSDSETANLSCQNSTSIDFDDFETSSCSSLSAVTVLGRDAKRQSDISKCSVEKSLSADISTFSNSTYSLGDAVWGLFNDGNKTDSASEKNSRCPSKAETFPEEKPSQNKAFESIRSMFETLNVRPSSEISNSHPQNELGQNTDDENECHSDKVGSASDQRVDNVVIDLDKTDCEDQQTDDALGSPPLRRSPSSESMTTTATDMTTDSLDSRCPSPSHPSPTPSLVDLWISRLVPASVPYSRTRRKSKKKLVLPDNSAEEWEHVCQRHREQESSNNPNLIDKLAHYGSKTGSDVAGYFQSLKQDVLKEHLKSWLGSNNQSKRNNKAISEHLSNECSHTKPLVNGQETNLVDESGMHSATKDTIAVDSLDDASCDSQQNVMDDSLEDQRIGTNENIYCSVRKKLNKTGIDVVR